MKQSKYNFIFPIEGSMYLIYNAVSGGFAKVDSQTLAVLQHPDEYRDNDRASQVLENLKKGTFVVEKDFDELKYLKVLSTAHRFASHSMGVTIAPTLECNFDCTYCYETHAPVTMNKDIITSVKKFFEFEIKKINGLGVTWFGGEPLIAFEIVKEISQFILNQKEITFEAGMITNGYLLTRKIAEQLKELKTTSVQITLDGPPETHDKRRPLRNGKGTFERILTNITDATDILKVSIRVNVDESNIEHVPEVLDILGEKGLKDRVCVYFAPVLDINMCRDAAGACFSYETYSQHEIELYKKALEKKFQIVRFPVPLKGCCGAVSLNSFLIDPYGNFHKCWNTVGVEGEAVGKIGEPLKMNSTLLNWLSWDPFEKGECRECKFLPICMGGCPYLSRIREVNCSTWKYNLEEMLRLYYTSRV